MIGHKKRLQDHANALKADLRSHYPEQGAIVNEFIKQLDPKYDPSVWQRYSTFEELQVVFEEYLNPNGAATAHKAGAGVPPELTKALETLFASNEDNFEANLNAYKIAFTLALQKVKNHIA